MFKRQLIDKATQYTDHSEFNFISSEIAITEDLAGLRLFDAPLFGFADVNDDYFLKIKDPQVVGEHFMPPSFWLPDAKSVISFFMPFTMRVKQSNRVDMSWPSLEWLHARIEGQSFIELLCYYLKDLIEAEGFKAVIPSYDSRFWGNTSSVNNTKGLAFTSNWSERHVAHACGLGTWGLAKGLITEKGTAGRFGSLVTDMALEKTEKLYSDTYEYCTMCGACVVNCPVDAISLEFGKDHAICSAFVNETEEKHAPRYGCGKCQVKVPCENKIPVKRVV